MVTRIKICGFTRNEDVVAAVELGVDALGFVFYPGSPRFVEPECARALILSAPPFVSTVGLFVNASLEQVVATLSMAKINLLQFHGDETAAQCHAIAEAVQRPFLRALRVKPDMTAQDLLQCESHYRVSSPWFNALLLDTFVDSYGGSGKVFDWSIIPKELAPRVVLSGGLTAHNVNGAVTKLRPGAVDISSGVEFAKGLKDPVKMHAFISAVRLADTNLTEQKNEHHSKLNP